MTLKTPSGKQALFISHYLENGRNGLQAAKSAGYKGSNRVLATTANRLLNKPHIRAAVDQEQKDIQESIRYSAEDKRRVLWNIAQAQETEKPHFSILAIAELNKMDGDLAAIKLKTKSEIKADFSVLEEARKRLENLKKDSKND
ncbi:terminase small subunit [Zooshikella marina]|uniref:terminase small subunit n=1 Tax=Zooshikella ganghwensis TaxID=202772 RepID=UPI001BAEA941|nr:terminase small subunit [Zooshikella ganghwensis]MBU2708888.1 terminase small subunit [Zooshikella ganghwensis]